MQQKTFSLKILVGNTNPLGSKKHQLIEFAAHWNLMYSNHVPQAVSSQPAKWRGWTLTSYMYHGNKLPFLSLKRNINMAVMGMMRLCTCHMAFESLTPLHHRSQITYLSFRRFDFRFFFLLQEKSNNRWNLANRHTLVVHSFFSLRLELVMTFHKNANLTARATLQHHC